ncbi:MAG: exosortase system-associated protein, TIGR04073 family [Candidatus Sumerlaeia bacterium]
MKPILLMLIMTSMLLMSTTARATDVVVQDNGIPSTIQPDTTKGPYYYYSDSELRGRKFARGFANVLLCPAEIPNQMFQEAYKTSPVTGMIVGLFKGVAKGGARLGVGVWEMATFYFPSYNNYQPIVEPEVVFQEYLH